MTLTLLTSSAGEGSRTLSAPISHNIFQLDTPSRTALNVFGLLHLDVDKPHRYQYSYPSSAPDRHPSQPHHLTAHAAFHTVVEAIIFHDLYS